MTLAATRPTRLMAALSAACAVTGFAAFGGWSWLTGDGNVESALTQTGALGPIAFVAVMWVTQPVGVPGAVYMVPAGVVWPAPLAVALCWLGNMGSSWLAFSFARWFARDWVSARIPSRLHRFDERLSDGGLGPIVALRVVFGQIPAADWLLGITRVTPRRFLVGTAVGIVPGILVFVILGGGLLDAWKELPALLQATLATLAIAAVAARQ
ncbi:MAG: TVP38/TMEM64 family protein, partial [Acidimicrobiales bacterium]